MADGAHSRHHLVVEGDLEFGGRLPLLLVRLKRHHRLVLRPDLVTLFPRGVSLHLLVEEGHVDYVLAI